MAKNVNYRTPEDAITFNLLNPHVVDRLRKDGDIELPPKKVSIPKDKAWNTKLMSSKLLKGLENGDSIAKISKSLEDVIGNNKNSAIRNARTMVTGAENRGRLDSYKELSEQGMVMKKEWMATPDDRTRPTHIDIDGEEVEIDEEFSNGCQYPGDAKGPAEEVWMCRCSMRTHVIGFRRKDGSISYVNYDRDSTLHDTQMVEERGRRAGQQKNSGPSRKVINGKDISQTWKRRPDKFAFEIEDVINAQGFDGLPRVVSADEFDRYVEESNFVAQRTYSAPDQETLDAYKDQLYNGKWYVDCSTGGAAYGQGMYCAGNYSGTLTDDIRKEMQDYIGQNKIYLWEDKREMVVKDANEYKEWFLKTDYDKLTQKEKDLYLLACSDVQEYGLQKGLFSSYSNIETFTIDSSAKVIDYNVLEKQQLAEGNRSVIIGRTIRDSSLNDEELAFVMDKYKKDMFGHEGIFTYDEMKRITELSGKLDNLPSDEWYERYDKAIEKLDFSKVDEQVKIGQELKEMNIGSYAASKGYDAIRTDHGTSGADTIILNRTKLIIKGE